MFSYERGTPVVLVLAPPLSLTRPETVKHAVQGYLTRKKLPPPRTLHQAYA
jgi:hypothetical protein